MNIHYQCIKAHLETYNDDETFKYCEIRRSSLLFTFAVLSHCLFAPFFLCDLFYPCVFKFGHCWMDRLALCLCSHFIAKTCLSIYMVVKLLHKITVSQINMGF